MSLFVEQTTRLMWATHYLHTHFPGAYICTTYKITAKDVTRLFITDVT